MNRDLKVMTDELTEKPPLGITPEEILRVVEVCEELNECEHPEDKKKIILEWLLEFC